MAAFALRRCVSPWPLDPGNRIDDGHGKRRWWSCMLGLLFTSVIAFPGASLGQSCGQTNITTGSTLHRHTSTQQWRFLLGLVLAVLLTTGISRACTVDYFTGNYQTMIFSYTPQSAIAGATQVYVTGSCFGDNPGTVKIGGVPVPPYDVLLWSDGEIRLVVPFGAQTGALEVDSLTYGSDTSTNPADGGIWVWGGTGAITGTFTVLTPNNPGLYDPIKGSKIASPGPPAPQYIEGTWNYESYADDAGMQFVFLQGLQNADGSYPVWGTYIASDNWGDQCSGTFTGTLSINGLVTINAGPDGCGGVWSEEWVVLNSGDATSGGWVSDPSSCTPPPDFPANLGNGCWDTPLIKDATEVPSTETPSFLGWVPSEPSKGAWQRIMPQSSDGIIEFSGRLVFEQAALGGGGDDGCYDATNGNGKYPPFASVSGGGWYVNGSGIWGSGHLVNGSTDLTQSDDIGLPDEQVRWYQANVGPCVITLQQTMFIDSLNGAVAYNTGDPYQATNQLEIDISTLPGAGVCTSVTPNGGSATTACETYP